MAEVKLVVIYPRPTDVDRFEKLFLQEHIPMAIKKLANQTKIVATKVTEVSQASSPSIASPKSISLRSKR